MSHQATPNRYQGMAYRRCGRSGALLPAISLGLWNSFGGGEPTETMRRMLFRAFDLGITHFDLANNYGPPPGSAEENFGRILAQDLSAFRDELIISTKAGYRMWAGPYGEWGSRKYLLASLDASLGRMKLDYVDIFYSHRPDPNTPLEETMSALDQALRSGKALYAGVSNYSPEQTLKAHQILAGMGHRLLIHQPKYSMLVRTPEQGLLDTLGRLGVGCIPFSPLAQGLLTDKYLHDIPADSRAAKPTGFLQQSEVTPALQAKLRALNALAADRGQSLAEMALAWILRDKRVTSVLVGASRPEQIAKNLAALKNTRFDAEELARIDAILAGK